MEVYSFMNEKLEKFLNPKKYREKKAKDFLNKIKNLDFGQFNYTNDDAIKGTAKDKVNDYIFGDSGVKKTSGELYKVISEELKKDQNVKKAAKNKESSCYYLSEIQTACAEFNTINKNSSLEQIIKACDNLRRKFLSARSYSNKYSFLSVEGVKKYMGTQHENFRNSVDNMKRLKKN